MSAICFILGTKVAFGNSRSKSNIKTRRKFSPNLIEKSIYSDILKQSFSLRLSTRGLRTIYKYGSLDNFLLQSRCASLIPAALSLKRKIKKKALQPATAPEKKTNNN